MPTFMVIPLGLEFRQRNQDLKCVHGTFTTVIKVWKEIFTIPSVRDAVYWFYEYCGVGHPIVKEDVKFSAYPLLRTWERKNRKKTNDQADNLFMLGRYYTDHRTIETITCRPWLESEVSELDDVRRTLFLSNTRMPLQVPNGNYKYYLGDRCWRQLTDTAGIPLEPPLSMSPHLSPADLQAMRQASFVDCE
ncbi:hypothetical protein GIB67_018439 [Kingdonia uniflora]|uniref:Uncharacterized protein n=1 Tax=Kingdonia uniflora TaxID=39325 RepID=A0A7J7LJM4_9MAGN|nr:hypothetical protein GIB67_018439 [Kingdonia uniflora]